jgi:hypothetical protein
LADKALESSSAALNSIASPETALEGVAALSTIGNAAGTAGAAGKAGEESLPAAALPWTMPCAANAEGQTAVRIFINTQN